jgi:hypothetical protein
MWQHKIFITLSDVYLDLCLIYTIKLLLYLSVGSVNTQPAQRPELPQSDLQYSRHVKVRSD